MKKSSFTLIALVIIVTVVGVFFIAPDFLGSKWRQWRLGLDLVGGSHLVYEVDMTQVEAFDRDIVFNGLRDVIERRVNLFGVSEPQVLTARSGEAYRLIVELAGVKEVGAAINQIGETPFLVFAVEGVSQEAGTIQLETDGGEVITPDIQGGVPEWQPSNLTGRHVQTARLGFNQVTGEPEIALEFNKEGGDLFEEMTRQNLGRQIGIFLDGALISAPVVNQIIPGGRAQITGRFTIDEAKALVERFNAGALPAPITLISQQTIGATLGSNSLMRTLYAGAVGTFLVIIFMLLYYRKLGIFASVALIIYITLLLSLFKVFGITMTLAGIAGIILSIGMAVDANILIFERSKEEILKGKERVVAMIEGFNRAWPSIRDSNITTIITSLILYTFTSSFVKGFALALLLGVLVSMFSAITVTKGLLVIFAKEGKKS